MFKRFYYRRELVKLILNLTRQRKIKWETIYDNEDQRLLKEFGLKPDFDFEEHDFLFVMTSDPTLRIKNKELIKTIDYFSFPAMPLIRKLFNLIYEMHKMSLMYEELTQEDINKINDLILKAHHTNKGK